MLSSSLADRSSLISVRFLIYESLEDAFIMWLFSIYLENLCYLISCGFFLFFINFFMKEEITNKLLRKEEITTDVEMARTRHPIHWCLSSLPLGQMLWTLD